MSDFHYIVERDGAETVVRLRGDLINELADSFDAMGSLLETRSVIFDCEGIEKVNSIGVRHWLGFLDKLSKVHVFRFRNCGESFMDSALMIPGFTRNAPIDSFYVTLSCPDCSNESRMYISVAENKSHGNDKMTCEKCGNQMEYPSDFEEQLVLVNLTE